MTAPNRTTADLVSVLRTDADQAPDVPDFLDRHPIRRRSGVMSRRRALSIAAVVLVIVALAVTLARRGQHSIAPASTSNAAAVAGRSWALVQVGGSHGSVDLARDHPAAVGLRGGDAWITFGEHGTYHASDSVNSLGGRYTTDRAELTLYAGGTSLVGAGPTGDWPDTVRAAMKQLAAKGPAAARTGNITATVRLSSTRLVLTIEGYVLTFEDAYLPEATRTYLGLTLRFPAAWHAVPTTFLSGGVVTPLGYITTQTPVAQCRPSVAGGHVSCGPPTRGLRPGDVLVIVQVESMLIQTLTPNSTIAGLPATVARTGNCGAGGDHGRTASIRLPAQTGTGRTIIISVCTRSPTSSATAAAVPRLFTSATYRDPSDTVAMGTVHGQVHLIGGDSAGAPHIGVGDVLVYRTARRDGRPLLTARIDAAGSYSFTIRTGTYWLSTTAATYNSTPCASAPALTVDARSTIRRDIVCHVK